VFKKIAQAERCGGFLPSQGFVEVSEIDDIVPMA